MLINCDIGERGVAHEVDDQLMRNIDIANIACGGHAGCKDSAEYYYSLAKEHDVKASVHLSYPDQKNFGRVVMDIDDKALLKSLDQQYKLLSEIKILKFHGALYNEANVNRELAELLMNWAKSVGIKEVLSPEHSEVSRRAEDTLFAEGFSPAEGSIPVEDSATTKIIHEVFLDRRYVYLNNRLSLKSRKEPDALIVDVDEAVKQYQNFNHHFLVIDNKEYSIKADTGCIHSDSDNALELIRAIKSV